MTVNHRLHRHQQLVLSTAVTNNKFTLVILVVITKSGQNKIDEYLKYESMYTERGKTGYAARSLNHCCSFRFIPFSSQCGTSVDLPD